MRDPDAIQAYEAKQQRFVEETVECFHQADMKDYQGTFGTLAVTLLQGLTNKKLMSKDKLVRGFYNETHDRITTFLKDEHGTFHDPGFNMELWSAERQYLWLKIFEKIMGSVSSGIIGAYQAEEIHREYKPE